MHKFTSSKAKLDINYAKEAMKVTSMGPASENTNEGWSEST
jgi:hypothetical protein